MPGGTIVSINSDGTPILVKIGTTRSGANINPARATRETTTIRIMNTSEVEYILDIIPSPFTTITVCLLFKPFILREFEIRSRGSLLPDDSLDTFFSLAVLSFCGGGSDGGGGSEEGIDSIFSVTCSLVAGKLLSGGGTLIGEGFTKGGGVVKDSTWSDADSGTINGGDVDTVEGLFSGTDSFV